MRSYTPLRRLPPRKRQLLAAALMVATASGCASSRPSPSTFASDNASPAIQADQAAISWDAVLAVASERNPGGEVQPVGFDNDVIAFALPKIDSTVDENDNGPPSSADDLADPTKNSPVEYFVELALASHPKIQAARQRVAAQLNRVPQARALPDPMFNNTFWPVHDQALQTAAGRVGHQMSLSQAVPWPEKLRTKAAIASREVQVAEAEVERIEREITESVRLAYYEVWYASRAIAIIKETQGLVNDLTTVAEARYRSGGTQQDVLRAQLEGDRLTDQMISLAKQKQMAQADLAALVRQPMTLFPEANTEIGLTDVPQQLELLIASAEQCSPELKGLAWEIQRDRQQQRLACLQKYPDLQFGVNWGLVSDDSDVLSGVANGHDNISFTVGTSLPIRHDKINAGIREAAHRTSSSVQQHEAERDALFGKLRRLMAQADALVEQRRLYKERILPRTEDTLKLSIADYRGKRTDFLTLIETYRELLMFDMQLARIEANLAGIVAQIERAAGCPTPRS